MLLSRQLLKSLVDDSGSGSGCRKTCGRTNLFEGKSHRDGCCVPGFAEPSRWNQIGAHFAQRRLRRFCEGTVRVTDACCSTPPNVCREILPRLDPENIRKLIARSQSLHQFLPALDADTCLLWTESINSGNKNFTSKLSTLSGPKSSKRGRRVF